ncbi:UDP-N-acetylmuramoylalanine--D-glutamate ligase [Gossypium arboreum]|uniref:UDP-N-acetylmuramoylalanine--D-glutamate ligase n=1 Tax=Gossypium arboreum TaxID=29729 RepID=A0A0B0Q030_GOSAR|nr:UDP-N-acetylmuramoylalanine--D-glutamate ligase [Gossypium arboreum]
MIYCLGSFKGEILAAVGKDGKNQIFSLVWTVMEGENRRLGLGSLITPRLILD